MTATTSDERPGWPTAVTPVRRFWLAHAAGLLAPLAAGWVVLGWRAPLATAGVVTGGLIGWLAFNGRGRRLDAVHVAWLCLLTAALLPAHLAANAVATPDGLATSGLPPWPILPLAGLLVAVLIAIGGGRAGARVSPVLVVALLASLGLGDLAVPRLALTADHAVTGDLLDYERRPLGELDPTPWVARRGAAGSPDARWRTPAREILTAYTADRLPTTDGRTLTPADVIRDRLPPLEDAIVLGHPAAIGTASVAAALAGGLLLFYRGVADVRITAVLLAAAYATLCFAPIPAALGENGVAAWSFPAAGGRGVPGGWETGLTFAHYELLCGPTVFLAVFVAPLPALRPLAGRWRIGYAVAAGVAVALAGRYVDAWVGPLAALFALTLLTPLMDRLTRARTLL